MSRWAPLRGNQILQTRISVHDMQCGQLFSSRCQRRSRPRKAPTLARKVRVWLSEPSHVVLTQTRQSPTRQAARTGNSKQERCNKKCKRSTGGKRRIVNIERPGHHERICLVERGGTRTDSIMTTCHNQKYDLTLKLHDKRHHLQRPHRHDFRCRDGRRLYLSRSRLLLTMLMQFMLVLMMVMLIIFGKVSNGNVNDGCCLWCQCCQVCQMLLLVLLLLMCSMKSVPSKVSFCQSFVRSFVLLFTHYCFLSVWMMSFRARGRVSTHAPQQVAPQSVSLSQETRTLTAQNTAKTIVSSPCVDPPGFGSCRRLSNSSFPQVRTAIRTFSLQELRQFPHVVLYPTHSARCPASLKLGHDVPRAPCLCVHCFSVVLPHFFCHQSFGSRRYSRLLCTSVVLHILECLPSPLSQAGFSNTGSDQSANFAWMLNAVASLSRHPVNDGQHCQHWNLQFHTSHCPHSQGQDPTPASCTCTPTPASVRSVLSSDATCSRR